ncbi:MAG: copper chaperone PCu(A)C [Rhodobacteraceae bacterium]|nr:copper chaperone PCu(A)C [Paracoccaceae bacterium]
MFKWCEIKAACAVVLVLILAANPAFAADISVSQAWMRATIGAGGNSAAYMTIANAGSAADVLTGVTTPVAGMADVHQTVEDNGMMKMEAVPKLEIPAGGSVSLSPGGYHVMVMQVGKKLTAGDTVPMTLTFERAGAVDIDVPVVPLGASGPG